MQTLGVGHEDIESGAWGHGVGDGDMECGMDTHRVGHWGMGYEDTVCVGHGDTRGHRVGGGWRHSGTQTGWGMETLLLSAFRLTFHAVPQPHLMQILDLI